MSRLTRRGMYNGLAGFCVKENDGSESFISWQDDGYDGIAKLAHYEDLEAAGRLILLPCELREEVWVAHELVAPFKKSFSRKASMVDWIEQGYVIGYTKAEAEAKLAELKGE